MTKDKKERDGIILESMTGSQQLTAKVADLARDKPWLVAGLLVLAIPSIYFGGKTYLGVKDAEKAKVDTVINIAGGDPADQSETRNPLVDAIRAAVNDYPGAAPIRVAQYFADKDGTFQSDIAARGMALQEQLKQVSEPQLTAHGANNCFQNGEFSSCPLLDKQSKLKAFVEVKGTTEDAQAFLSQNGALILPAVGDAQ